MSSEHGTPSGIFVNFLAAILKAAPRDLANDAMLAWIGNGEELSRALRVALAEGPRQTQANDDQQSAPAEPQTSHADIRITRMIGGQEIVFVGFLRHDDADGYVLGDIMLERVSDAGFEPVKDSSDLEAHKSEWANDPELAPFYVVTNERHPEYSRGVRCFDRDDRERYWYGLGDRFDRGVLVACRAQ